MVCLCGREDLLKGQTEYLQKGDLYWLVKVMIRVSVDVLTSSVIFFAWASESLFDITSFHGVVINITT